MIMIEKPFDGRQCNICHKTDNILEFYFRSDYNNNGMTVALCSECRATLHIMLDALDLQHSKHQMPTDPHGVCPCD